MRLNLSAPGPLILAGLMSLLAPVGAHAAAQLEDKAFTVANYPVEATAKDAVAAKSKAIEDGQQAAFRSLLKRIVPVTAYNRMDQLKVVKAAEYIDGFAVRSEQNSPTQYIANLDFSFQPDAVRELLRGAGVPFVDAQAQRTILIPVLYDSKSSSQEGQKIPAAGAFRPAVGTWNGVWRGLDLENTLTPVRVEALKAELQSDTMSQVIGGGAQGHAALESMYKSAEVVVAVAEPDLEARRLSVTLAGQDAVGPLVWKRSYRLGDGDLDYAMELAAVVALGVLEGRWKAVKSGAGSGPGDGSEILVAVEFHSATEWDDIRGRLLNTPGIEEIRVGTVTDRSAEVTLRVPGGPGLLANELAPQGLSLRSAGGGWLLRSSY